MMRIFCYIFNCIFWTLLLGHRLLTEKKFCQKYFSVTFVSEERLVGTVLVRLVGHRRSRADDCVRLLHLKKRLKIEFKGFFEHHLYDFHLENFSGIFGCFYNCSCRQRSRLGSFSVPQLLAAARWGCLLTPHSAFARASIVAVAGTGVDDGSVAEAVLPVAGAADAAQEG